MASCLRALPMTHSMPSSTSNSQPLRRRNLRINCCSIGAKNSAKIPMPPINPKDPFLARLASVAANSSEKLLDRPVSYDTPPYLDSFDSPQLVATSAQLKNEIHTIAVGAAIGRACLLLAAGTPGKRFMMPHAKTMIQQPKVPSSGLMPASDVLIRAKEAVTNRDVLVELLAKHTGNSLETVADVMKRPFYMDTKKAKEFGVIDKILWRDQEKIMADVSPKKNGTRWLASKFQIPSRQLIYRQSHLGN